MIKVNDVLSKDGEAVRILAANGIIFLVIRIDQKYMPCWMSADELEGWEKVTGPVITEKLTPKQRCIA